VSPAACTQSLVYIVHACRLSSLVTDNVRCFLPFTSA